MVWYIYVKSFLYHRNYFYYFILLASDILWREVFCI